MGRVYDNLLMWKEEGIDDGVKTIITAEELLKMSNISPCELVKGELIQMSPGGVRHGKIAAEITRLLGNHVKAHGLGTICTAETGFRITRDPDTVRAPDVAYVSKERISQEGEPDNYLEFAPDLAVEVVSPNDRWSEVEEKVEEWLNAGTSLVWVVNPKMNTIHVYRPAKVVKILTSEDTLTGEDAVPGFSVSVKEIFA